MGFTQKLNPSNHSLLKSITIFYNKFINFRKGLELGASVHWNETLYILTGERKVNAEALLEYFEPLYEYLKEQNNKSSAPINHAFSFTVVCAFVVLLINKTVNV